MGKPLATIWGRTTVTTDDSAETKSADQDSGTGKFTAEAAKWRVRCRELEAERDGLVQRIDQIHREQIAVIAGAHLQVPDDLLSLGTATLDQLRTEDGALDVDKVNAAAQALVTSRPGLGVVSEEQAPSFDGGARTSPARSTGPTYSDVLRGTKQGFDNLTPR
jgi:hypothetical protein